MICAKSPEELIQGRFSAFLQQDFESIFLSYHTDAPFRSFFPQYSDYLEYALTEIAPHFEIIDCCILRSKLGLQSAEILYRLVILHNDACMSSLEIARCRKGETDLWFFDAALRIDASLLSSDPQDCSWEDLVSAGNDLWI